MSTRFVLSLSTAVGQSRHRGIDCKSSSSSACLQACALISRIKGNHKKGNRTHRNETCRIFTNSRLFFSPLFFLPRRVCHHSNQASAWLAAAHHHPRALLDLRQTPPECSASYRTPARTHSPAVCLPPPGRVVCCRSAFCLLSSSARSSASAARRTAAPCCHLPRRFSVTRLNIFQETLSAPPNPRPRHPGLPRTLSSRVMLVIVCLPLLLLLLLPPCPHW